MKKLVDQKFVIWFPDVWPSSWRWREKTIG